MEITKRTFHLAGIFALAAISCRASDAVTERASRLIAALDGAYQLSFASGTVAGETYIATDSLVLVRASDTELHFSLRLNFYNGHTCSAEGTAEYQPNGQFVYRRRFDKRECVLEIVPTDKAILLRDPTGNCRIDTCGLRGGYQGASFARSLRKPVPPPAAR
jgi:hypothetical protein